MFTVYWTQGRAGRVSQEFPTYEDAADFMGCLTADCEPCVVED